MSKERRYAIQIACELPEDMNEALRVLELAKELIRWAASEGTNLKIVSSVIKLDGSKGLVLALLMQLATAM